MDAEARSQSRRGSRNKPTVALSTATAQLVQQAKALMNQGNRRQAMDLLDRAANQTRVKTEIRELTAKRRLFAEQFLTAESFQSFQEARGLSRLEHWDECARELDAVGEKDRDNLLVLELRAECQMGAKQYALAEAAYKHVLSLMPADLGAALGLAEIAFTTKQSTQGLSLLEGIEPSESADVERLVILKSKLLEQAGRAEEGADLLKADQEAHLDHINVLYELGMLYSRISGRDWPARKMLSLFVTRCKRLKATELKARKLDQALPAAQATLAALDKKLGV